LIVGLALVLVFIPRRGFGFKGITEAGCSFMRCLVFTAGFRVEIIEILFRMCKQVLDLSI
jgi:hypothetical protein